jgi:hypothetical protein
VAFFPFADGSWLAAYYRGSVAAPPAPPVAHGTTTPGAPAAFGMAAMPGEAPVNAARDANAHKTTHRAVPKGAWTKEEDETVMRLVGLYGPTR